MRRGQGFAWGSALVLAGLIFAGCKSTTGPKFDPRRSAAVLTNLTSAGRTALDAGMLRPATDRFTLGPGDVIEIELFGDQPPPPTAPGTPVSASTRTRETGTHDTVTIGPDGKIYYYLLPGLDVWGLTLAEARDLIERELGNLLTTKPRVGVTLRGIQSKRIWLLGRFRTPGMYPVAGPTTLLEAISVAGGAMTSSSSGSTKELADLRRGFVVRNGERLPLDFHQLLVRGDLSQNIFLQPDDFVYLPSALGGDIYILGAVRTPRAVSMEHATVAAAVAYAGGTVKDAHLTQVAVVRGSLSDPQIAIVDYKAIVRGDAPDVQLEPRDIVYVPYSPYRTLRKYADLILTTFVRAVAINEGARAVSRNSGPVSVGISITP